MRAEDWLPAQRSWGYIAGAPILQPETCPGYTSQLPAVLEVAEAWGWWEKSQLGTLHELPPQLAALVSLCNREIVASRAFYYEETKPR